MYRKKDKSKQTQLQMLCLEDPVPQDHMLREIESAIDWSFIYGEVKGLYKEAEWGNPGSILLCFLRLCLSNLCTASEVCAIGGEETKEVTRSTSDPECGLFHKGEHEKQFAYVAGTACDIRNFILGFSVAPGNTHDSVMFDDVYNKTVAYFPEVEAVVADSVYRTPWIAKKIIDDGRIPSLSYKRPMTPDGYFRKYEYVYDEYYDCILCPNNQVLKYSTTNREGYREYKSDPNICKNCPCREQCTRSKDCQKTITRHIWEEYMEKVDDYRHTPWVKDLYDMRKQKIERVFADAKVKHGLRYTQLRGLAKVTMQVTLTFACMNLKKLAKWKRRSSSPTSFFAPFSLFFQNIFSSIRKSVHASAFAAV